MSLSWLLAGAIRTFPRRSNEPVNPSSSRFWQLSAIELDVYGEAINILFATRIGQSTMQHPNAHLLHQAVLVLQLWCFDLRMGGFTPLFYEDVH
jgi:hypothetical protein